MVHGDDSVVGLEDVICLLNRRGAQIEEQHLSIGSAEVYMCLLLALAVSGLASCNGEEL